MSVPSLGAGSGLRLTLPPNPELAGVARLTVAGVAARLGIDTEAIEDLKIAVAEALNLLLAEPATGGPVTLDLSWTPDALLMILSREGARWPTDEEAQIAELVMIEFADQSELEPDGPRIHLTKLRPTAGA